MKKIFRAAAMAALMVATAGVWAQETTLVVNSWGGAYEKLHKQLVFEPFEKANNVKIKVVTVYSADTLAQLRGFMAATTRSDAARDARLLSLLAIAPRQEGKSEPSSFVAHGYSNIFKQFRQTWLSSLASVRLTLHGNMPRLGSVITARYLTQKLIKYWKQRQLALM